MTLKEVQELKSGDLLIEKNNYWILFVLSVTFDTFKRLSDIRVLVTAERNCIDVPYETNIYPEWLNSFDVRDRVVKITKQ